MQDLYHQQYHKMFIEGMEVYQSGVCTSSCSTLSPLGKADGMQMPFDTVMVGSVRSAYLHPLLDNTRGDTVDDINPALL